MTTTQAKSTLKKAGLWDEARITISRGVEIEILRKNDDDHRNVLAGKVSRCLKIGGFKTGYGSWVLQEGYKSDNYEGKASRTHY